MAAPLPSWSYERLLQLAPDAGTLEQARRLFFARRWKFLHGNGHFLWGEYETAYGHLHQAVVRLDPPLFRCSCNSRRRPCKHALALVLLFLNRQEAWQVREELPEWAQNLLRLTSPASTTVEATGKGANNKSSAARLKLMDAGVEELDKWIRTLAATGLAQAADVMAEWESIATRMVDCKLGSIARRLRNCQHWLQTDGWVDPVVAEIGLIYLFVRAWQRKTTLSATQKRELLQIAGWNQRRENILLQPAVQDNWLVLGVNTGSEEKLNFRHTWLRGEKTGYYALLLDFSFGNRGFEEHYLTGSVLSGNLVYYPGQPPQRAIWRDYQSSRAPYEGQAAYTRWAIVQSDLVTGLAASPWLVQIPVLIDGVTPVYEPDHESFYLLDSERHYVTIPNDENAWKLLAASGGQPLSCFGVYEGTVFRPISIIDRGRIAAL